ncbi:putative cell wall-binding protein [Frondihabitans australicus]|uniref:Putative cell wall-binding protein n=1 Tax=Frondihabitans australicus TaxID=386892 RepID=A0A495IGE5_9MICO|nr:putative cell wall-binding protein [Frondihabitans australicus]
MAAGAAALLLVAGVTALGAAPASAAPAPAAPTSSAETSTTYPTASRHALPIEPTQLLASHDGSVIYAPTGTTRLLVIDPKTIEVIRTITLPDVVSTLRLTSTGHLVGLAGSGTAADPETVVDVDPSTGVSTTTALPTGAAHNGLAVTPDGSTAAAATLSEDATTKAYTFEVTILHPASGAVITTRSVSAAVNPNGMTLSVDGSTLYGAARFMPGEASGDSALLAMDSTSGAVTATAALSGIVPSNVLVSPDGSRVFVSSLNESNNLSEVGVFTAPGLRPVSTITLRDTQEDVLQETGDGSRIIASGGYDVTSIDPTTLATSTIGGIAEGVVPIPGSSKVYFGNPPRINDPDPYAVDWSSFGEVEDAAAGKTVSMYHPGADGFLADEAVIVGDHDLYFPGPSATSGQGDIDHLDLNEGYSQVAVSRHAGPDRYTTAVDVAEYAALDANSRRTSTLFLVSGEEYPDALSAGPVASHEGGQVLLTTKTTLPNAVISYITHFIPHKIVIVGSTASISQHVADEAKTLTHGHIPVERVAGADRYATSRALVTDFFGSRLKHVWIATGRDFPDALATVSAASFKNEPLILVDGSRSTLDSTTAAYLRHEGVTSITVVGSESSVSTGVAQGLASIAPVARISGSDRYETSKAGNDSVFPRATTATAVLTTGEGWADALAGDQLAAPLHSPMELVPPTCLPDDFAEQLSAHPGVNVHLLGGTPSLSTEIANFAAC